MKHFNYPTTRFIRTILLLVLLSLITCNAFAQKISLNMKNATVQEAITAINKVGNYSIIINTDKVDINKRVNVFADNADINNVLEQIFAGQDVTFFVDGKRVLITKNETATAITPDPDNRKQIYSGYIKDSNGPVIGAIVMIKGTRNAATTDINGGFSIAANPGDVLVTNMLGYHENELTLGNQYSGLTILITEDTKMLEESVVIGYGTQKKTTLTGAVAVRDLKEIENRPMTHASEALYSMPGLYVNQASSKPGSDGAKILIRGVGTLSNASPMVLVDGMEYSLSDVNPDNIETISVLKDASASIYGSKAANGVILITTKQARKGMPVVKLKANFGLQAPTYIPDVVTDPIQYMRMKNQAELNEGKLATSYAEEDIQEYAEGMKHDKYIYPASDWYDLCYQNGIIQEYNASVSGGSDNISYIISAGYMGQKGVLIDNDNASRYSWDMKINSQVTKRLKIMASLLGNLRFNREPIYGVATTIDVINRALPIFGTELPDGKYLSTWIPTPGRNNPENPLMEIKEGGTSRQIHHILGQLNLEYKLPWGFKYNANLGYVKIDHYSKNFKPALYTYNPKTMEKHGFSAYVYVKDWDNNQYKTTFYNTLSWIRSFNDRHNFNLMIGTEYKYVDQKNFQAKKRNYFNNQLDALSPGTLMDTITGSASIEKLFSYFGRFTYNYKEKYMIDLTMRYDGSSKFDRANRWGFFPAISAGWRIDKEGFMRNAGNIDLLKLRGSIGKMGNQAIDNYEYMMSVLASNDFNYSFNNILSGGAGIVDFVDREITWEATTTYDIGLDLAAFGNRLTFGADLYKKISKGILRTVMIPAQIGNLKGPKRNIGTVANDGIELSTQWRDGFGEFRYSFGGNFCYNKNIVVNLDGQEYKSKHTITKEGYPINSWYLYQADGFYNSYDEIANSPNVGTGVKPGYIKYKDLNNDRKITDEDRAVSGNMTPSITYAFNLSFGWKGLDLSACFQGVGDVSTYLSGNLAEPFRNGAGVLKEWITDAWTPENKNSRLPILHTATGAPEMHDDYRNTQWLYDAGYLRCKQLQLSYSLPDKIVNKIGMKQCQVFINGQNLFTFSKLKMFDPEIDLARNKLNQYPSLKTFNLGFNLTF